MPAERPPFVARPRWVLSDTFDDGPALYAAVCEHGLEGVVAKELASRYRPGDRGWVKTKRSPHAKAVGDRTFAELTAIWKP